MRRLTAALAAAVLMLFGAVGLASAASAAQGEVTITAPGNGGEDTTPLVEGTADPGAQVHVRLDDTEVAVVTADAGGAWSYQVTTPVARGTQLLIMAEVQDADGNVTSSALVDYYCWPDPAGITITSPTAGSKISPFFDVHAKVTGTDLNFSVQLFLDDRVVDDNVGFDGIDTLFSSPWVEDLTDGPHTLQIRGTDGFGRPVASQVVSVVGDATPPPAPVITSPAQDEVIRSTSVTIRGTAVPGLELSVRGWESGEPLCTEPTVVAAADGTWSCYMAPGILDFAKGKRLEFHVTTWAYDEVGNRAGTPMRAFALDLRTAAAPEPAPSSSRPASAVPASLGSAAPAGAPAAAPELANTGSSTTPGVALALLLIAVGLGLSRASRRLSPTEG